MDIVDYEPWMKPQVAKMFSMQYGVSEQSFIDLMDNFYDHPFQKNKCIRIVAKENDTIIGFQSFFYWPYCHQQKVYNSYQSGNSLVHPDYRGKGIFQKLLDEVEAKRERLNIDFFIGFPIEASVNSLIRNKWKNILNLDWHIKVTNFFSFLFPYSQESLKKVFNNNLPFLYFSNDSLRLNQTNEFNEWRRMYSKGQTYYYFSFIENNEELIFELKHNKRKKIIHELIIGNVLGNTENDILFSNALHSLLKQCKKLPFITILTVAINGQYKKHIAQLLSEIGFRKIKKSIYFCTKPFISDSIITDPSQWQLYRSDIDTW